MDKAETQNITDDDMVKMLQDVFNVFRGRDAGLSPQTIAQWKGELSDHTVEAMRIFHSLAHYSGNLGDKANSEYVALLECPRTKKTVNVRLRLDYVDDAYRPE